MKQRNEEMEALGARLRAWLVETIENMRLPEHKHPIRPEEYYLSQPLCFRDTMIGFNVQFVDPDRLPVDSLGFEMKHACLHLTYMPEVDAWTVGLVGGQGTLPTDAESAMTYASVFLATAALARTLTPLLENSEIEA